MNVFHIHGAEALSNHTYHSADETVHENTYKNPQECHVNFERNDPAVHSLVTSSVSLGRLSLVMELPHRESLYECLINFE